MPELPEVQTTVDGLNKTVRGKTIVSVWTDYKSHFYKGKKDIKDPKFFTQFQKEVSGQKIKSAERRGKHILINLSNDQTIIVHMKMTGYFYYDPKPNTKFVHLLFTLNNNKKLAFSDMRKFAKVTLIKTSEVSQSIHIKPLGPEPLDPSFELRAFRLQLKKKPGGKIKQVLLDQTIISGIGNIYSDEILWRSNTHPISIVNKIPDANLKLMFKATKETLRRGIDFGGDSMSDYKNIDGEKGHFQDHHMAYRRTKLPCLKKNCGGMMAKIVIGGRSAHFCPKHQKIFK